MQTNELMKVCFDTAEQFLPDQTNTLPQKSRTKIDIKKMLRT